MVEDTSSDAIWSQWNAVWRDVIILDGDNQIVDVYNLTSFDLSNPTNYDTLRQLFIDAANDL
jgi:hypothetical protein